MSDAQDHDPDSTADSSEDAPRWDANDPRRQHDQMAPPAEPCECYCLHCGRVFGSELIWFQKVVGDKSGFEGFWMCPTPNCGGAGFTFDIFPTDPDHPANAGWHYSDDDEDYGEDAFDENGDYIEPEDRVYNPDEPEFKAIDQAPAGIPHDIEGDEWKYGLAPGDAPPESPTMQEARRQQEEEERKYDEPDLRPREIDWTDLERPGASGEDEIPF